MKKFWHRENVLDEMQEQSLQQLEARGFWLLWSGLLIANLVQFDPSSGFRQVAGEAIVFMLGCGYMVLGCVRRGIWDRHSRPGHASTLGGAALAGAAVLLLVLLRTGFAPGALIAGACTAGFTALILWGTQALTEKRRRELDADGDENESESESEE